MNSVVQNRTLDFWLKVSLLTLAVWLGASLCFDLIVMPGLYTAGMMQETSFGAMGTSLFGMFNHLEFLAAGLVLTSLLVTRHQLPQTSGNFRLLACLAIVLMLIAAAFTYILSPQMGALGLAMSNGETPSLVTEMTLMHSLYGVLEILKLLVVGFCLKRLYRLQTAF